MEAFLEYLSRYIELSPAEESLLVSKLKRRNYLKGQYLVQGGEIDRFQNFIVTGLVKTFYLDEKGNEHIVALGIENWWVGDICSFSTQTPAEFNAQCLAPTTVIQISYPDMQQLYLEIPKLERFFRLIIQKAYGNMAKRLVRNHALPAKERYLLYIEEYPEIFNRVPQYLIASYLGITKEFLSSLRKQIAQEPRK